jgi:hypothetical protein
VIPVAPGGAESLIAASRCGYRLMWACMGH